MWGATANLTLADRSASRVSYQMSPAAMTPTAYVGRQNGGTADTTPAIEFDVALPKRTTPAAVAGPKRLPHPVPTGTRA